MNIRATLLSRHPLPAMHPERAQSMVEFAMVLPILMLLFLGIFDLGRMVFLYTQVSNGAREAARYGAVSGGPAPSPQYLNCAGIRYAATRNFGIPQSATVTIAYDTGRTAETLLYSCETVPSSDVILNGYRIRVTVSVQAGFITPVLKELSPPRTILFTSARTILKDGAFVPYH